MQRLCSYAVDDVATGIPEDYVIATGKQYSVREFIRWTAEELGLTLEFTGKGIDEVATVVAIAGDNAPAVEVGDIVMRIDPRYFRPAEVDTLLGDPAKAKELGGNHRSRHVKCVQKWWLKILRLRVVKQF